MYTVNQVFTSALRAFAGTQRDSFASPNGIVADAVRSVRGNVDLIESRREVPLTPALYIGDNAYQLPDDVDTITDLQPSSGRTRSETAYFNRASGLGMSRDTFNQKISFATEFKNGMKLLRVQPGAIVDTPTIIHNCDDVTSNGNITVSQDANSLDVNKVFFLNGFASLDFNLTPSAGTATFTIDGLSAVDISNISRDGVISLGLFVPEKLVGHITSINLKVGSNNSNYYTLTANTNSYGGEFIYGFNIVRFEMRSATPTGTPDLTNVTWVEGDINHDTEEEIIGIKVDAIAAHRGRGYTLSYYSTHLFRNSTTGATMEVPTNVGLNDIVQVENDGFNLIVHEAQKIMDLELRGEKAGTVYQRAERKLNGIWGDFSRPGLYEQYRLRHPSERRSIITQYEAHPYE